MITQEKQHSLKEKKNGEESDARIWKTEKKKVIRNKKPEKALSDEKVLLNTKYE